MWSTPGSIRESDPRSNCRSVDAWMSSSSEWRSRKPRVQLFGLANALGLVGRWAMVVRPCVRASWSHRSHRRRRRSSGRKNDRGACRPDHWERCSCRHHRLDLLPTLRLARLGQVHAVERLRGNSRGDRNRCRRVTQRRPVMALTGQRLDALDRLRDPDRDSGAPADRADRKSR